MVSAPNPVAPGGEPSAVTPGNCRGGDRFLLLVPCQGWKWSSSCGLGVCVPRLGIVLLISGGYRWVSEREAHGCAESPGKMPSVPPCVFICLRGCFAGETREGARGRGGEGGGESAGNLQYNFRTLKCLLSSALRQRHQRQLRQLSETNCFA